MFDLRGRVVKRFESADLGAGRYEMIWWGIDDTGRRVSAGVYFYRLRAGSFVQSKRMILLR